MGTFQTIPLVDSFMFSSLVFTFVCQYFLDYSDPGLATLVPKALDKTYTVKGVRDYFCPVCHIVKLKRVVHCNTCDVCVENFSHHCGLTGKCISSQNEWYLYLWGGGIAGYGIALLTGVIVNFLNAVFISVVQKLTGSAN